MKKKVLVIFGTRPEVIKMAPVVKALQASTKLEPIACATAQHRDLLDQVLGFFNLKPDLDLNVMRQNQDLFDVTEAVLTRLKAVLRDQKPDLVLVQGDTTTTFAASLAAFYARIPVGHVEAGLRTWQKDSPFPEEMNRQLTTRIADYHFAPTRESANNLEKESIEPQRIYLTGNTSIDALLWAAQREESHPELAKLFAGKNLILMTAHRRENFGAPLEEIFTAIRDYSIKHPEMQIVYPVHPNPNVVGPAQRLLGNLPGVSLIAPLGYAELVYLMRQCQFVVTDSGGLQEEAPTLGKPVVVLRESTERPEAVSAGCALLVGSDRTRISDALETLTDRASDLYQSMSQAQNPFGDGTASQKIVEALESVL